MATIKKKDLKDYKVKKDSSEEKEDIEELVDADGSPIEGGKVDVNDTEIETAPQQTSDEFADSAIQPNRYYYGIGGTPYSHGDRVQSESVEIDEVARTKMRKMVEDLLSTKSDEKNFVTKYKQTDVNRNNIPDLDELTQKHQKPIPAKKAQALLNTIQKNNLNGEEVGIILNFIINNIDTSQIPNDFRRILKGNI